MSYAALILAHRDPAQVERLADRLGCPTWVHYDAKSPVEEHRRLAQSRSLRTVPQPAKVIWGHWSVVVAMLKGLRAVEGDPDHVLVLSGDAYPIKPRSVISERLRDPVSFVYHKALPREDWEAGGLHRVERVWVARPRWSRGDPMLRLPLLRRRTRVPLYGGSGWFVLHRDARKLLLDTRATRPVRRQLRWSIAPDEMFVPTVLVNSALRSQLVNDHLHYLTWTADELHPMLLGEAHWDDLTATPALFARKFDSGSALLDRIDRELLG